MITEFRFSSFPLVHNLLPLSFLLSPSAIYLAMSSKGESTAPSFLEKEQDLRVEDAIVGIAKPDKEFSEDEEDKMYRRMDWRIMPILALLYRTLILFLLFHRMALNVS